MCPSCGEPMGLTVVYRKADLAPADAPPRPPPRPPKEVYARFLTSPALEEPLELEDGTAYRIGRARSCEVCFPSGCVSRLHAEVVREGTRWMIGDLGSKNGTFVNEERIYRRPLCHGDRIAIGHFDLVFNELSREETLSLLKTSGDDEADTASLRPAQDGLYGDLAQLAIVEVVQLVGQNRRTGCLVVESTSGGAAQVRRLFFDGGAVVHAETGTAKGQDAAAEILKLRTGQFQFLPDVEPDERTIDVPTQTLLLRAVAR